MAEENGEDHLPTSAAKLMRAIVDEWGILYSRRIPNDNRSPWTRGAWQYWAKRADIKPSEAIKCFAVLWERGLLVGVSAAMPDDNGVIVESDDWCFKPSRLAMQRYVWTAAGVTKKKP